MRDILLKEEFKTEIDGKTVLQLIQCYENSPIYNEVLKEYDDLKQSVLESLSLRATLCFTTIEKEFASVLPLGSPVLYVIATIGEEVSELSRHFFNNDEYLKGMLVDVMADAYLFEMEVDIKNWIIEECTKRSFGVSHRYEAPVNIPMEAQKIAYEATEAGKNLGISITSGYMFDPVKTNCHVLALTQDTGLFQMDHDCSECNNSSCTVRRNTGITITDIDITVVTLQGERSLEVKEKESLLDSLIRNGIILNAVCNGNGTCGKCKVFLIDGELDITCADEKYLSKDELSKGWRLACKAKPKKHCKIMVSYVEESEFEILLDYKGDCIEDYKENNKKDLQRIHERRTKDYSLAVDIGTTTLVITLVNNTSKLTLDTYTSVNGQRVFGADVIARIQASLNGSREALRSSIHKDLLTGFEQLTARNGIDRHEIKEIVISGNTTMLHLLMGFDCSKLGVFPFTPVNINLIKRSFREVFLGNEMDAMVTLLPGISTFVGADIVSGLYFCGLHQTEKINLLIDLGTNGEMGIGNKDRMITTSTAAGPAFEGGNITWGMGSMKGAICNVEITANDVNIRTIGNKEPLGICGTGIIEIVAEMVINEIIDETGLLIEDYFEGGFPLAKTPDGETILVTQKDIRELQLAKSAIRAGVETLCLRYGVTYEQVDKVYIAGGFGTKLDQEKAITIGMLPEAFRGKIEAVGNSSLGGAVKCLIWENSWEYLKHLVNISSEINLANDIAFNDFYVKHMFFGEID